jgi:hypothetical protein
MPDFEPILPGMVNWEKAAELRSLGIFGWTSLYHG